MSTGRTSLPADVVAKIAADFPHERLDSVLAILDEYKGVEGPRIIRCIIHLASGSTNQLLDLIANANADYRNVVYWAEYDRDDRRIRDFTQPFAVASAGPGDVSLSFVGGRPLLSSGAEIPTCALCSERMCFFFQVALPVDHRWQGALVAVFQCVSCCSEDALIPEMPSVALSGAEIPPGFLTRYQTNFRIVVSDAPTAQVRNDYHPLIQHASIDPSAWRIGAEPQWLLDDEAPGSYESFKDPVFLFQVPLGMAFIRCPDAPPQKTMGLEGEVVDADGPQYELFLSNASYFFGFGAPAAGRIYVVTQTE